MEQFHDKVDVRENHSAAAIPTAAQLVQSLSTDKQIITVKNCTENMPSRRDVAWQSKLKACETRVSQALKGHGTVRHEHLRCRYVASVDQVEVFVPFVTDNLRADSS